MALFAISDLHLSFGTNKPMDIFGVEWEGYIEKIKENWWKMITEKDWVLIPGDISWATYLEDTREDFDFLNSLPGTKVILKGNHDYWWGTVTKMRKFFEANGFDTIKILHNNCYIYDEWAICGTRGWSNCDKGSADENNSKIFAREVNRLKLSLQEAKKNKIKKIIVGLHFPPFDYKNPESEFIRVMREYNVEICIYGHLHSSAFNIAKEGYIDGIYYKLVSSDYLNFKPYRIL